MNGTRRFAALVHRARVGLGGALLVATVTVILAGCSEHRITLDEFLERMDQQAEAPVDAETADQEPARAAVEHALGPYKVGPGDVLQLTFTGLGQGDPMLPFLARIDRNGEVNLPVVGALKVANLELEDVEDTVHQAFVPAVVKDAAVHVELVSAEATEVLVIGAVTVPGLVQLRRTERDVLHAIVAAGGVSELASGTATLQRVEAPEDETSVNLTNPDGLRSALTLAPLEDGDILTVEAATPNTIFVGGLVNLPSPQLYPAGVKMTVLQVLAAAGGLRTDVTPREATLVRRMPDNTDIHVKLDLDRVTTGKDPNIVLAAGDILWVPDTLETRVQDWINRNIFIRAGINANLGYNVSGVEYLNRRGQQSKGYGSSNLQDSFDPLGFLTRNAALQSLAVP